MSPLRLKSRIVYCYFNYDKLLARYMGSSAGKSFSVLKSESTRFIFDCMRAVGTPVLHAEMLASNLIEADYRGHYSHGLNRLEMYVDDIKTNVTNALGVPSVLKDNISTAWVDGRNSLGVVVGTFCMKLAITKAKESGIGWVAAKNSNHFGICQWYTDIALKAGLIGMAFTNTSPLAVPTRACEAVLGTNPICVSRFFVSDWKYIKLWQVSASGLNGDRFVLDMATTAVSVGKIEMKMRESEPLPSPRWVFGESGQPTIDAYEAFHRGVGLQPLGGAEIDAGYKGYGLALFVDLICGVMSGAASGRSIRKWMEHNKEANLGQVFVALDPDCFAPGMSNRLQNLMDDLRSMKSTEEVLNVLVPGDPEKNAVKQNDDMGCSIRYTPSHIETCKRLAQQLNVPSLIYLEEI